MKESAPTELLVCWLKDRIQDEKDFREEERQLDLFKKEESAQLELERSRGLQRAFELTLTHLGEEIDD